MKHRGSGEGTFYKRPNGLWSHQRTVGLDNNGKPIRLTVYGRTKKECIDKMNERLSEHVTKSSITLGRLMEMLVNQDLELGLITESTYYRKKSTFNKINKSIIANIPIQQLTEAELTSFMREETKYANSVVSKDYALIKRTLNEAVKHEIIKSSPLEDVRKPKSKKKDRKIRALSVGEEKKLIDILNNGEKLNNHRYQLLLMLYTGMRMGEINALTENDVSFKTNTIQINKTVTKDANGNSILGTVPKTDAGVRTIKMNNSAQKLLKEYLSATKISNPDRLIFYDYKHNKVMSTLGINAYFLRIKKKYDFINHSIDGDVTLHSLRHTFATRCIESGMPPKVLQHILGHSDISVTLNTYCDVFNSYSDEYVDKVEEYMNKVLC